MAFRLPLFVFITSTILCASTNAQRIFSPADIRHEIAISEMQYDKLDEIEKRYYKEIEQLQATVRSKQQTLRTRQFENKMAVEAVLTTDQKKSLNEHRRQESRENALARAKFMNIFAEYLQAIAAADDLTIYEGLPRAPEPDLEKIKAEHETIEIDGWSFYAEALPAEAVLVEQLRTTLVNYQSFGPHAEEKYCGGFHPDLCVEWTTDGKKYYVQLCLGCFEAVFIAPSDKAIFDFDEAAWKSIAQFAIETFNWHDNDIRELDAKIGR